MTYNIILDCWLAFMIVRCDEYDWCIYLLCVYMVWLSGKNVIELWWLLRIVQLNYTPLRVVNVLSYLSYPITSNII